MNEKKTCPICNSQRLNRFLTRENVPVHQNYLCKDQKSAIDITRGHLQLVVCEDCGFVFNQTFSLSKLSYGEKYDNAQDFSPMFEKHISNLVNHLVLEKNVKNCNIVEVGCGKGSFLKRLVKDEKWANNGFGFDPSYDGPESILNGRLKFQKSYYDSKSVQIPADVIICRHVIEHVPEPLNLIQQVHKSLKNSSNSHVFFETPTVEWILKNNVVWDFFYEHCSLFSKNSIKTAFEISGFVVEDICSVFQNQYLWLEASVSSKKLEITKNPDSIPGLATKFSKYEQQLIKNWKSKIQKLKLDGNTAIWGAGAKGVTFANLIDPHLELINSIIDLNPNKQGKFLPGTGHPIINYKNIPKKGIKNVILMNPNYYNEILTMLNKEKIDVTIIN